MKDKILTRIIAAVISLSAFFQINAADRYVPLPPALDGSMMPYDFSECTLPPNLPDSLRPIYAAYVARHGARYLSGPGKMDKVMKALEKGRNTGTLSATGEAFLSLMIKVREANEGNWGDLSPAGIMEERLLGSRLHEILPSLSESGTNIFAISSYVPRAVMTMYQLTNQLIRLNDSIEVRTDEGHQYSPLVCCFSANAEYAAYRKDGDWKHVYDDFVERHVSGAPARRLFTSTGMSDRELRKLTLEMYEVLKGNRAAGLPAPTTQWMSGAEYEMCWRASNLQHYLRNSITPLSTLAAKATSPLLDRIIDDADRATAYDTPYPAVNGYFGHAETLLPLLSLMNLPGCFDLPLDYTRLEDKWKIQNITPLGANLLILIARAPSGNLYATLQLNGRTIRPLKGHPDVVKWTDLKDYWRQLMKEYNR